MPPYGGKDLARSFRTVRTNTIMIAEDIPEQSYGYRATPAVRSVSEMLAHVAVATLGTHDSHTRRLSFMSFEHFMEWRQKQEEQARELTTKAQIVAALKENGERFASWLEGLPDDVLAEEVGLPPPVDPPSKTRFEMLLGVKEHEMHHRAQLMLIQRLLGIVPHLTRRREQIPAGR
jgi:uncharacterized damage-inducible protein DinB